MINLSQLGTPLPMWDTNLREGCRKGNPRAWERLFAAWSARVYRWAVLRGLGPTEAEDAAQEVLAIAARRIEQCRSEAALGSWLFQITRRVAANTRRLGWLRRMIPFSSESESPAPAFQHEAPADVERELAIRRCLATLPRAQAEVLMLMEIEGLTREEAAEMLGIPPGTVASRLRLGREAFRARWEEEGALEGAKPSSQPEES